MTLFVTGGAGFIGSAFVREALRDGHRVVIYDLLTYAGHKENISDLLKPGSCEFIQGDIGDTHLALSTFKEFNVDAVVNFAAESHVDNSIHSPRVFLETNILGTFSLLQAARQYSMIEKPELKNSFRFVHVSTDEVFGALGDTGKFSETTPYAPNSPYSASKASSDHIVRAWFHTYGLPTIITNCSNNYGPRQFPEKLIPTMIQSALSNQALPVYGNGKNVRDWIHVEDHAHGVMLALRKGIPGNSYCFGGNAERNNLDVVKTICRILDEREPRQDKRSYDEQIKFVDDRKGHDFRYAIDDSFAQRELGFTRKYTKFEDGLMDTIKWYLQNQDWVAQVTSKKKETEGDTL